MLKTSARKYWLGFRRTPLESQLSIAANDNFSQAGGTRTTHRELVQRVRIVCRWSQTADGLTCRWQVDTPAMPPQDNRTPARQNAADRPDRAGLCAQW